MAESRGKSLLVLVAFAVWFLLAVGLSATGQIARLIPPQPQLVVAGLTVTLVMAGVFLPRFRDWLALLPLRALVAFHVARFIGIYFLVLYGRGELPWAFAVPGGIGDIVVATTALMMVLLVPGLNTRGWLVGAWNLLGLIDILFVVATGAQLGSRDPGSMAALLRLPLSLLPTFLVPLIIASHLLIFRRLRQVAV